MSFRHTEPPVIAAAKAGFSTATAYRIEEDPRLPSQKKAPRERRRRDPLGASGTARSCRCSRAPGPAADRHFRRDPAAPSRDRRRCPPHPGAAHPHWRALNGAEQDVIFRQEHPPGRLGLSDFTDMDDHGVMHRRCAARSSALSLPPGLLGLGARPCRARRRELRGAGRRIAECAVGARRRAACSIAATACRPPSATSIAMRRRIRRAATRRCARITAWSRPATIAAWRTRTVRSKARTAISSRRSRMRCCCAARATSTSSTPIAASSTRSSAGAMRATPSGSISSAPPCKSLPARRTTDYEETIVTVTSTSGFILKRVFYSVPSRLIGHRLRVRLYDDRLECFLGATH